MHYNFAKLHQQGHTKFMNISSGGRGTCALLSAPLVTLTYVCGTWTLNEGQTSMIQEVEMSYLKGACGVKRMVGENTLKQP